MSARAPMHAGEAVAEALRAEGVQRVYSVPGSHIHPIYDGLSRVESIRFVACKQEPNVSLMADAYGTLFQSPHFADMARACGADGIRVSDPKHIEEALRQGLAATKRSPALVEVMVQDHPYPKLSAGSR